MSTAGETSFHYDGKVQLLFNPAKHLYTVDGNAVYGVTSILGVIAKPQLIAWAANEAAKFIEENLKPGQSLDEIEIKKLAKDAAAAHRMKRDKSADIGHLAHAWVEHYIKTGEKNDIVNPEIQNAVDAFLKWESEHSVQWLKSEVKVLSRIYNYAGTFDFIAIVDGKKVLGDLKTGSGVYPEMFLQTSAYQLAYQEEFPKEEFDGHLILNARKDGGFEAVDSDSTDFAPNSQAFMAAVKLYAWQRARGK